MVEELVPGFKVVIIGDTSVGKTSILTQYNLHYFSQEVQPTIGSSFLSSTIQTEKGPVTLNIWDTAGQEKYRCLVPMYSRSAIAAIIVIDASGKANCTCIEEWVDCVRKNCSPECKIYIVANKIDLPDTIPMTDLIQYAQTNGFPFFSSTATLYNSVAPIFNQIACDISLAYYINQNKKEEDIDIFKKINKKNGCC
ncbi:small GTP-binding protein [Histomonas meleagridis]|uniref:small GTP-binding protein n=1 Tax=Histomonas meleagridis TaxID=135588 RepID=UPI003559E217|nr:small GTP-binding protein [Histomonas meleagridis]KAH0804667.1 small GTP-binding protein [Histomonas meleagridis]